jgi:transcriptional regulator with XRE-family HTH domain
MCYCIGSQSTLINIDRCMVCWYSTVEESKALQECMHEKVKEMQDPQTWRELLGRCIADTSERQRIAEFLGVAPITLTRWVSGESTPRPANLRKLLVALPQHRERLLALIQEEYPGFSAATQDEPPPGEFPAIPSEFYSRVLYTVTSTPKDILFRSLSDMILQQALKHLDPGRLGMAIIMARCMPPSRENKVRSLRESVGRGSTPWGENLEQQAIFLGAESLTGYAVMSLHLVVNQNLHDERMQAAGYRGQWEESAAATPIKRCGGVAGSLLVSSTQPDYFVPARCTLVEEYAALLALAFDCEDFYEPQRIELGLVPSEQEQRAYFSGFQQRVLQLMKEATREKHPMTYSQAEQQVWQQIEEELLRVSYQGVG